MPKVKTITLDGGETAVKFPEGYPYYIITNLGDGELYASGNPDIVAYADGVYTILPGTETRISHEKSADTVYLLGSGMVQVRAEEIAVPTSFRAVSKGGDGSGSKYLIVDELPDVGDGKYTYLVPVSDYLSDNKYDEYIWLNGEWEKVGTPTVNVITDYNDLNGKPSINNITIDGNKTLHDYGLPEIVGSITTTTDPDSLATTGAIDSLISNIPISDFDGKYTSLSGTPVKMGVSNAIYGNSWVRLCTIKGDMLPYRASLIITVSYSYFSFVGALSYFADGNNTKAYFTIISASGDATIIPTTRIETPKYAGSRYWYDLSIDILINSNRATEIYCSVFLDSNLFSQNQIIFPYTVNPTTGNINHMLFTFENKVKDISVDSSLSETSTNPVQNSVITAAINALSDRISQLEE